MLLPAELIKYDIRRLPDWRFSRVLRMVDRFPSPGRSSKLDDEYVKACRNFILAFRSYANDEDKAELLKENPALFCAYTIYEESSFDPGRSLQLQARILSNQTSDEIAEVMSIPADAVDWYERIFFDIRDRLKCRDWITLTIIMPAMRRAALPAITDDDSDFPASPFADQTIAKPFLDGSLKYFSYFGGPVIADIMINGALTGKPCASQDAQVEWITTSYKNHIRWRAAKAAMQFEINKFNVTELFLTHNQIIQLEQSADASEGNRNNFERHVKAMLDGIPWSVGDDGKKLMEGTVVGRYDNSAVELRDEELLIVSEQNRPLANIEVETLRLPPPRKKKPTLDGGSILPDDK